MITTHRIIAVTRLAVGVALVATCGCANLFPSSPARGPAGATTDTMPKPVEVGTYLEIFDRLEPGDPARQSAAIAELAAQATASPTATNRLRYAIALGAAGRPESNPVEARRLITELLAAPNALQPKEVSLAKACLREFDARVALYADLARQREELEHERTTAESESDKRIATLNSDNQRLRKALAEAERKLEAVAEMENSLTPPERR